MGMGVLRGNLFQGLEAVKCSSNKRQAISQCPYWSANISNSSDKERFPAASQ